MPKVDLTSGFVRSVGCPAGRAKLDYFDLGQRGFMLEVRASGGKTFYQRYTDARGRERKYKLGPAEVLTLDKARRKARLVPGQAPGGGEAPQPSRPRRAQPPQDTE